MNNAMFLVISIRVQKSPCFSLQVNGMSVEGKTHSEVVAAIKVGGNVTRLLVVDPETEAFFKRCGVSPTSDHLTGEISVVGRCLRYEMLPACFVCSLRQEAQTGAEPHPAHLLMSRPLGES